MFQIMSLSNFFLNEAPLEIVELICKNLPHRYLNILLTSCKSMHSIMIRLLYESPYLKGWDVIVQFVASPERNLAMVQNVTISTVSGNDNAIALRAWCTFFNPNENTSRFLPNLRTLTIRFHHYDFVAVGWLKLGIYRAFRSIARKWPHLEQLLLDRCHDPNGIAVFLREHETSRITPRLVVLVLHDCYIYPRDTQRLQKVFPFLKYADVSTSLVW
jgi:hypothetical protein